MRIATWNVNSIRMRAGRLRGWLAEHQPAVICLQETKVEDSGFPTDLFSSLGYQVAFHGQKSYNGVAIAAKTPLADVAIGLGDPAFDDQTRVIAATVEGLRVVSVYVPNGQQVGIDKYEYKLAWLAKLRAWLDRHDRAQPILLGGDWNVAPADLDVHDPARWAGKIMCSDGERAGIAAIAAWGLTDAFRTLHPDTRAFSWWDYRSAAFFSDRGLRIDHFFVDAAVGARLRECTIDRDARKGHDASDHAPVIMTLA
jgi:exodeoxyribonuclease III